MAGILVHGPPTSASISRVLTCLFEKNVEFAFANVSKDKLRPFGRIPVLKDCDVALFDSRAICRYVCDKYADQGTQGLYGLEPLERASVEQWLEAEAQFYGPPCSSLVTYLAIDPRKGKKLKPERIERCVAKLEKVLDVYERRLGESRFLAGDRFTLADLSHLPNTQHLVRVTGRPDLIQSRENVHRWWKEISGRPSWKKVLRHRKSQRARSKASLSTRSEKL